MSDAQAMIARAREIRLRLRRPENAVFDDGINLKRKKMTKPMPQPSAPVAIAQFVPAPILMRNAITVGGIIRAVAQYYGDVTPKDIKGDRRNLPVVRARHMVFYLASIHCRVSTTHIGYIVGGKDHSTVIHGRDAIREKIAAQCPETTKAVLSLESGLYAGLAQHQTSVSTIEEKPVEELTDQPPPVGEILDAHSACS